MLMSSILGEDSEIVQPPQSMEAAAPKQARPPLPHQPRSVDLDNRKPVEGVLVAEGVHRELSFTDEESTTDKPATFGVSMTKTPTWSPQKSEAKQSHNPVSSDTSVDEHPRTNRIVHAATFPQAVHHHHGKGQAHNPLEDHLYLNLGPGSSSRPPSPPAVSESPPTADIDIYETAYRNEVEQIRAAQGRSATLFLTRRVDKLESTLKEHGLISHEASISKPYSGLTKLIDAARVSAAKATEATQSEHGPGQGRSTASRAIGSLDSASNVVSTGLNSMFDLVSQAKTLSRELSQPPPERK